MSLFDIPRHASAVNRATRVKVLHSEETLNASVRARAADTLSSALARGLATPGQVERACAGGDRGIARLIRRLTPPSVLPGLSKCTMHSPPPEGFPPLQALIPWIRMLAHEGCLDQTQLSVLSDPANLTPQKVHFTLFDAWNKFRSAAIATSGLPPHLHGSLGQLHFNAAPLAFNAWPSEGYEGFEATNDAVSNPTLLVFPSGLSHVALPRYASLGVSYHVLRAALFLFQRSLNVPLFVHPDHAFEVVDPMYSEVVVDLYEVTRFVDGQPTFDETDLRRILEGSEFIDPSSQLERHVVPNYKSCMKFINDCKANEIEEVDLRSWLAADHQCPNKLVIREIVRTADTLAAAPRIKSINITGDGFAGMGNLTLVPSGTGLDGYFEDSINSYFNSGDADGCSYVALPSANPARLGEQCRRVLTDLAALNYVESLIQDLSPDEKCNS